MSPIRKTLKQPDFTRLQSVLAQTKDTDNPTYQVISELIDKIRQMQTNLGQGLDELKSALSNQPTPTKKPDSGVIGDETFITVGNETPTLANSSRLVAGTNVTLDTSTVNQIRINASGGSSGVTPHHATHETGGSDPINHLNGGVIDSGTVADARLSSNIPKKDVENIFALSQTIGPRLALVNSAKPVDNKRWDIISDTDLTLYPITDAGTGFPYNGLIINRTGTIKVGGDIYEKQRLVPLGHWQRFPYNSSNFQASQGTWTVSSGNVLSYDYTLIGKTLLLNFYLSGTTVSNACNELQFFVPNYPATVGFILTPVVASDNNGPWGTVWAAINNGEYAIRLRKDPTGATTWSPSSGGTSVTGQIIFSLG